MLPAMVSPFRSNLWRPWVIGIALVTLADGGSVPAQPQQPSAANPVAIPGFWDPRRRPERPDLSRITLIRFLTEIDYPPFNYAGADGNPTGFNVDLARMICEELKIACTVQMRRFDTLLTSLAENRGDAVMASIAVTPRYPQACRFQRRLLPHAGPLRGAARGRASTTCGRRRSRAGGGGGRRHRARGLSQERVHRGASCAPIRRRSWRARRCAGATSTLMFGDGISLAFWLNGTEFAELLRLPRRPVHREPLFRRRGRHRGQARQRHAAPGLNWALFRLWEKGRFSDLWLRYFPVSPF